MPFKIERNDITRMAVDAIVNAANESLLGGGGVDGAIHAAAGPALLAECRTLGGCKTGQAKLTKGYDLPAKYIIHTVGPVWRSAGESEELLRSCYRNSLALAKSQGFESVAFPLISAGAYGCPKDIAYGIAKQEILDFLKDNEMDVTLVIFDSGVVRVSEAELDSVKSFIDDHYVEKLHKRFARNHLDFEICGEIPYDSCPAPSETGEAAKKASLSFPKTKGKKERSKKPLFTVDESFSEMLLRLIDEKGIKDSDCYYKANRDRKLFSKIRGNREYRPSKETALAFALALELDLDAAEDFLKKAGFSLSDSILSDVIVKYCIVNKKYDIMSVNELLWSFDQKLL